MSLVATNHEADPDWREFYHSYLELHGRPCMICYRNQLMAKEE